MQASFFIHLNRQELEAGLGDIKRSPLDNGTLQMIVGRPAVDEREVLGEGRLDLVDGLVGDTWRTRENTTRPDGSADPEAQLTVMNSRLAALVAGTPDHGGLAGDQLYIDFDLSVRHLAAGSRLQMGEACLLYTSRCV